MTLTELGLLYQFDILQRDKRVNLTFSSKLMGLLMSVAKTV